MSGRSDMASLTVMVLRGADDILVMLQLNWERERRKERFEPNTL